MRDPVELEIFQSLFHSIAEEMGAALRRTAFSPNIKERRDMPAGCPIPFAFFAKGWDSRMRKNHFGNIVSDYVFSKRSESCGNADASASAAPA
jgi:hypothetical protein